MTNTSTADAEATAKQIAELAGAGSELVRITVNSEQAAQAVEYEIIRDQRFLSGEGLSAEEILTSRRALATGSRLQMEIGISYRFGSIFNTVVNQRFLSFD